MQHVALLAGLFGLGLFLWPFLEYAIHGWLAHRFRTFASPLHWAHHAEPHRVFTSPIAWVPGALALFLVVGALAGPAPAGALVSGIVTGFLRYELVHYKIHFTMPRSRRRSLLRAHHLAHHFCNPNAYHGVTTRWVDRLFGTLPANHAADYAKVATRPPLTGRSNLGQLWPRRVVG
jgi:hypothetical protein